MERLKNQNEKGLLNNFYLKAFLLGLGLSFILFIPYIIRDGGRFLFYGDFNVQQVPFYRLAHDAIVSGNIGWSHTTDLGANLIGSYAFYLLGSPFFWLTIPFPGEWLQYLMGPLLILKFACAVLTSFTYLNRYAKNKNFALVAAVMYAFSGFSIYNVFFNHFHEAIVFFPLLLWALDEYMYTRRRGIFALMVFVCCTANYYFFVGQVVFIIIYFFIRMLSKSWKINLKDFLLLALESIIGLGMSCLLLVPAVLATIQNNRVSNPINGWNAVLYNKNQRYIHILVSFFFPPDLAARPNFTPDSESKWASIGAWLPLFSMTGVIGWLQLKRKQWAKKLIYVLFVMALVPGLNAAFQLFNASYYARWFYMLTLIMALVTMMSLENSRVNWKRSIKWTALITMVIMVVIGLMPKLVTEEGEQVWEFGLEQYPTRFWSYAAISFVCLAVLVILFRFYSKNEKQFAKVSLISISIISVLYSSFFIALGKTQSADPYDHIIPYALNGGKDLPMDDLDIVRSDFYESLDNSAMFWQIPSIQAFHSIVPGSIMEFYPSIGVTRDVGSRADTSHYGLRALTSVRWLFDDDDDDKYFAGENYEEPSMPGWIYYGNANGFDIWENEFYIPMGFSYDKYISRSELEKLGVEKRELMMLKALVIEDEDIDYIKDILSEYNIDDAQFTESAYQKDCLDRSATACSSFTYTNKGFDAMLQSTQERIVFFSVPYEDGWTATVNGESAEILTTNVGFMAVRVPAGDEIRISFNYTTPGLFVGILITGISVLVLAAYLILIRLAGFSPKKNRGKRRKLRINKSFAHYTKKNNVSFKNRNEQGNMRILPRKQCQNPIFINKENQ